MREEFFQEYRFANDIEIMQLDQKMKANQARNTIENREEYPYFRNCNEE